jgi:hypothetical protein
MGATVTQHTFGALVEILAGGAFLTWAGMMCVRSWSSRLWPQAEATILSSTLAYHFGRGGPSYTPTVSYSYQIAGQTYTGDKIDCFEPSYMFKARGWRRLAPYGVGSRVKVSYDAERPSLSVLEPGMRLSDLPTLVLLLLIPSLFLVVGILGLVGRAT